MEAADRFAAEPRNCHVFTGLDTAAFSCPATKFLDVRCGEFSELDLSNDGHNVVFYKVAVVLCRAFPDGGLGAVFKPERGPLARREVLALGVVDSLAVLHGPF